MADNLSVQMHNIQESTTVFILCLNYTSSTAAQDQASVFRSENTSAKLGRKEPIRNPDKIQIPDSSSAPSLKSDTQQSFSNNSPLASSELQNVQESHTTIHTSSQLLRRKNTETVQLLIRKKIQFFFYF